MGIYLPFRMSSQPSTPTLSHRPWRLYRGHRYRVPLYGRLHTRRKQHNQVSKGPDVDKTRIRLSM